MANWGWGETCTLHSAVPTSESRLSKLCPVMGGGVDEGREAVQETGRRGPQGRKAVGEGRPAGPEAVASGRTGGPRDPGGPAPGLSGVSCTTGQPGSGSGTGPALPCSEPEKMAPQFFLFLGFR